MTEKIITLLPEIALIIGIIHLIILKILQNDSAKLYAATARFWVLISLFCSIAFYDSSSQAISLQNNSYSLLFIMCLDISVYIMLSVTAGWFAAQNQTGCRYNIQILISDICFKIMLPSIDIKIWLVGYIILMLINNNLLRIGEDKKTLALNTNFFLISVLTSAIFALSVIYLMQSAEFQNNNQLTIADIKTIIATTPHQFLLFLAISSILLTLLYAYTVIPLYIASQFKNNTLPVKHYFALIQPLFFLALLLRFNVAISDYYQNTLSLSYATLGIIFISLGALGTKNKTNLHQISAYIMLYHTGIILLLLSEGDREATYISFFYFLTCLIGLNQLYLSSYNLKSHGEYLSSLKELSALSEARLMTSGFILISLFSLMCLPPLLGFVGLFDALLQLINAENYIYLGMIIIGLLFIIKAGLEIMKTMYSGAKSKIFDTENEVVLIYNFIFSVLLIGLTFDPFHIFEKIKDMFYVLFL